MNDSKIFSSPLSEIPTTDNDISFKVTADCGVTRVTIDSDLTEINIRKTQNGVNININKMLYLYITKPKSEFTKEWLEQTLLLIHKALLD